LNIRRPNAALARAKASDTARPERFEIYPAALNFATGF